MTPAHVSGTATAGALLRGLRRSRQLSQLELALRVGVSQRHLSFIETGRARPSCAMLLALLEALDAALDERNDALLAAGFAPLFGTRPLAHPEMALVRDTLSRLLQAHEPAPALVLDPQWDLLQANAGARTLFALLEYALPTNGGAVNMLQAVFAPDGLHRRLLNADQVCPALWHGAQRDAARNAALRQRLDRLSPQVPAALKGASSSAAAAVPVLVSRFDSRAGELSFVSTFTSFGSPLDVTTASLRVEHLFPADERTAGVLGQGAGAGVGVLAHGPLLQPAPERLDS